MTLEMKASCQRCQADLPMDGDALICSFECTFCPACNVEFGNICPNCGGELVNRPRRVKQDQ